MSPYTQTLATLRLSALQALQDALNSTTDPAELRRIAQAIFRAPPPDDDIDSALPAQDEQEDAGDAGATAPAPIEHARSEAPPDEAAPLANPRSDPAASHPASDPLDPEVIAQLQAQLQEARGAIRARLQEELSDTHDPDMRAQMTDLLHRLDHQPGAP